MAPFDFKKEYKVLYAPTMQPAIVEVPEMVFIMIDGQGDPNICQTYQEAVAVLYGLSYAIKMSKKSGMMPSGYFDYVVPPLEGLWTIADKAFVGGVIQDKSQLLWTAMIRQPEFVTPMVFDAAIDILANKKPSLDTSGARLETFTEGLCAQIMHVGPFDDEPRTIARLQAFIAASGYRQDMTNQRRHHEIYLSDPRKVPPERMKTVIRHPIT